MKDNNVSDIAHTCLKLSFLDMIKAMIMHTGAANAKGTLIRNAISTAESMSEVNYENLEDYLKAVNDGTNPIATIEGISVHEDEYVFGLKACPFATSVQNNALVSAKLAEGFDAFIDEYNKEGMITNKYRVGEGAGVSPFCAVHQTMRSAVAEKIKVEGKEIQVYQLGCKSGGGKKGFADKWIQETGVSKDVVDKVLDSNMCCYYLKIME